MKANKMLLSLVPVLVLVLVGMVVPSAQAAFLPGTTSVSPGGSVPLLLPIPVGTSPGTLLAGVINPAFSIINAQGISVATGTLSAAVYRNSTGTLDFYYQVSNNAGSADPVERETNFSFLLALPEWLTAVGFRTDGGSATLPGFAAGAVNPSFGDRSQNGDTVGFQFGPTGPAILPGQRSQVLVVSTDATNFTQGSSNVIDGGVATVLTFRPAPASTIPEPASFALLGGGLLALAGVRRYLASRV